jgi:1-deoxy-D-xylulose-5-phosphate reductoisomerase
MIRRTDAQAKAFNAVYPSEARRRVTILGCTGSIGCNTVSLLAGSPERFEIEALTAHNNIAKLIEHARLLRPRMVAVGDPRHYQTLRDALAGTGIAVGAGPNAVNEAAARPAEWVMAAIVGAAGLTPTLTAIRRGAVVALANKECLVCAGSVMLAEVRRHGATLLPVDSEHSAIFQVFDFAFADQVERIVLTASGGPFRNWSLDQMAKATVAQAVAHPNWSMGAKISIDSATMMNKGLELIEAVHLFPVPAERVQMLVHPQSVIHSMVAYTDGSVLAQMGTPDMRTPIAYALGWPKRMAAPAPRLDFETLGQLSFEAPDAVRFPAIRLARAALSAGETAPTVLNAANEVAVGAFLEGRIGFLDIARAVEQVLEETTAFPAADLDAVMAADQAGRSAAGRWIDRHGRA